MEGGGGVWREEAEGGAGLGTRAQQQCLQCLIVSRWVGFAGINCDEITLWLYNGGGWF